MQLPHAKRKEPGKELLSKQEQSEVHGEQEARRHLPVPEDETEKKEFEKHPGVVFRPEISIHNELLELYSSKKNLIN